MIVRDVDIYCGGELVATTGYLAGYLTSGTFAWFLTNSEALPQLYSWRGRQVFEFGDGFVYAAGAGMDVRVSGYLLDAP